MQYIYEDNGAHIVRMECADDLDTGTVKRTAVNLRHYTGRSRSPSWMGGTLREVTDVLRDGWPDGLREVESMVSQFKGTLPTPTSVRRVQAWGEDGDEPSWEREQAGHDAIWRTSKRQTRKGPVTVQLMAPWGGNAGRRPSELMWNGVVLAVLIDLLQASGYSVGASINSVYQCYGNNLAVVQVEVKRPEQPLDLASLVPLVAHPGVFRWHSIDAVSTAPFDVGMGHGSITSLQAAHSRGLDLTKGAELLPLVYDKQSATNAILDVLSKFINR